MLYGVIPIHIRRNQNISDKAKLLYCEVTASMTDGSYCDKSNKYFADIFGVTERVISGYVKELSDFDTICVEVNGSDRKITVPERMAVFENPKKEKKKREMRTDLANEVVNLWNELLGTKIRVTRDLITAVTARSKSFSDSEILDSIRNRFKFIEGSDWHNEPQNARHRNNIYLVIRSDKDLQKYVGDVQSFDKVGNEIKLMKFD